MAGSHGGSGGGGVSGGGFSGGGSRGGSGFRGGAAPARMTPGFARSGSRFGPGMSRNFRGDRDRFHHRHFNEFVFFGDPFFYDPFFYGYYPYGYYPYGYDPYGYGYGYGYDPYNQSGYQGVAAGTGSVREIQLRLARAGYYHGRIDGVMGPRTRYAIRAYERSHNSRVTAR
jgi:Putative peptidoglycan binding domain